MRLQAFSASTAISTTVATAVPLFGTGHALWLLVGRNVCSLSIVVIWARTTVNVVLAGVAADICAFVKWYQRVRRCSVT